MTRNTPHINTHPAITTWIWVCAGFVFAMIIIGAITRLTESGLSMVEWRPLIGALPPMNETEWNRVFTLYQDSPEYQKKNFWMSIEDFKTIFFWEWFHRFWGRMIGLVFALPLVFFWLRGMIPAGYKAKFIGLLILGGLQGLMGWYMVKSGLVDVPAVSHFRLSAHLSLAFIILCALTWVGLSLKNTARKFHFCLLRHGSIALFFVALTAIWGAFVAGMDAGLIYNEYPKMGTGLVPPDMWHLEPAWQNIIKNAAAIQFTHRWLAIAAAIMTLTFSFRAIKSGYKQARYHAAGGMVVLQVGLGIATLLSGVHLHIAVIHQAGAAILLMLMTACIHGLSGKRN